MYNQTILDTLPPIAEGEAWATLARVDGLGSYTFILNPESESWVHNSEFAKLAVANTAQPIAKYKYSESQLSYPNVKFWSPGNSRNLTPVLDILAGFTKPIKAGGEPPLLKLSYGDTTIDRLYLRNFTVKSQMKTGGSVSMAEGSLDFILAPELPKVEKAPVEDPKPVVKLTEKELDEASKLVLDLFTNDPKAAQKYSTDPKKDTYGVQADGKVLINGKAVGTLAEVLGDKLPDKWKGATFTSANPTAKTPEEALM